jgi:hypothetical protein
MKIGLFGNTNNYPYLLAEAIHSLGDQAELIVTSKELLHRPESLIPELRSGYPDWIVDTSYLEESDYFFLGPRVEPVLARLSACDALLLNSVGPSLLPLLERPAIALLTGSDLDHYANPNMVDARTQGWSAAYKASDDGLMWRRALEEFVQRQRRGIQMAIAVRFMPRGLVPEGDRLLDGLGIVDDRRIVLAATDVHRVKFGPGPRNEPVRAACGARLTWKLPVEPGRSTLDYKGSDIMIRGMSLFYRRTGIRLDIQLIRKGLHVKELQAVIDEQGLTDQVTWSPEMSLADLWKFFAKSDVVFDQLGDSIVGGAGLDAMLAGRPLIANAQHEWFEGTFREAPPICQAKTPSEVCAQLERLVVDPEERDRIGQAGRRYVQTYFDPLRAAEACLQRFQMAFGSGVIQSETQP